MPESGLRSLFIVGLPRSLTTIVYDVARSALGLQQPNWTTAGEILNGDRIIMTGSDGGATPKYTRPNNTFEFDRLCSFFHDVVNTHGYAYKDVVQPWVVSACLNDGFKGQSMAVLRVTRSVDDVASRMSNLDWHYPLLKSDLLLSGKFKQDALKRRLNEGNQALSSIDAISVNFSELITKEDTLFNALKCLYPDQNIKHINYINSRFIDKRNMAEATLGLQR